MRHQRTDWDTWDLARKSEGWGEGVNTWENDTLRAEKRQDWGPWPPGRSTSPLVLGIELWVWWSCLPGGCWITQCSQRKANDGTLKGISLLFALKGLWEKVHMHFRKRLSFRILQYWERAHLLDHWGTFYSQWTQYFNHLHESFLIYILEYILIYLSLFLPLFIVVAIVTKM